MEAGPATQIGLKEAPYLGWLPELRFGAILDLAATITIGEGAWQTVRPQEAQVPAEVATGNDKELLKTTYEVDYTLLRFRDMIFDYELLLLQHQLHYPYDKFYVRNDV